MGADYGWISLLPPALTIVLALRWKRVLPALFAGVLASHLVVSANFLAAPASAVRQMLATATDRDNFVLIAFSLMVGGLLALIRAGGGFAAFAQAIEMAGTGLKRRTCYGLNWLIGAGMFLEVWSNVLVNGATTGPLYDRLNISRARLAYYIHTIALCVVAVVAINAWGAFYMGLLGPQGIERPFAFVVSSIPYMLYSWTSLALVVLVMVTGLSLGSMRRFDHSVASVPVRVTGTDTEIFEVKPRAFYMLAPLFVLLITVFVALYLTGGGDMLAGDGGLSILYAIIAASTVIALMLLLVGRMRAVAIEERFVGGMAKFFDVGVLIVLALSLGDMTRQLGTGPYLAELAQESMPVFVLPTLVFLLGAVMSFSTGTSYGTFSIMVPIALPIAFAAEIDPHLMFGACIAGGLFGDNTSPISDTTIMTSIAAELPIIDHVSSQLPYALASAAACVVGFLLLGAVM